MMKQFSVMILCYNSEEDALRKTIDSVLVQEGVDWEIILADDCSKNDCLEFAVKYLDNRGCQGYKVMRHETNVGTVQNIYDALTLVEGEYVKCIGAGDLLYRKDTLKKVYDYMQDSGAVMCFGKMQGYRMTGNGVEKQDYFCPADIMAFVKNKTGRIRKNVVKNHGWIPGASMFYQTSRFQAMLKEIVGTVRYCEDLLQVLLFVQQENVVFFPYGVIYYEVGSGISTDLNQGSLKRVHHDHKKFWDAAIGKYPKDKLIKKGYQMFRCEMIPQKERRRINTLIKNPGCVWMMVRTRFQHAQYTVRGKGLLDQENILN